MKELYDATLSEMDFEQLPPALRRKFFSSLERLRLAQDGTHSSKPIREALRPFTADPSARSTSHLSRRPSTNLDVRLGRSFPSTRTRLRKLSRAATVRTHPITPQDVAQFASLPPTLQRKQFSREDQFLLASRVNNVILDAADEAVFKQYRRSGPRIPYRKNTDPSAPWNLRTSIDYDTGDEEMGVTASDLESLRWLDEPAALDLSLYDYHAAVAETAAKHDTPSATSLRRGSRSISSMSFNRSGSTRQSISNRISTSSSLSQLRPVPTIVIRGHKRNSDSSSSLDPTATHYQDPAARMKLRVYLASPQKFDEAVEFGFPSIQNQNRSLLSVKPRAKTRSSELRDCTFYDDKDDTPSLSDGDDPEDGDSPRTPSASAFSQGLSHDSSLDRSSFRPKITHEFTEPYVHAPASTREMTLHMTLTRPDLRSPEELSAKKEVNSLPLEQPPLIVNDTPSSDAFWDSLPDQQSMVQKWMKRLKLRA